jgi:hypothetical protein
MVTSLRHVGVVVYLALWLLCTPDLQISVTARATGAVGGASMTQYSNQSESCHFLPRCAMSCMALSTSRFTINLRTLSRLPKYALLWVFSPWSRELHLNGSSIYDSHAICTCRLSVCFSAAEPTTVPTLHVLFYREHPITIYDFPYPSPLRTEPESSISFLELRQQLVSWISEEALGGDTDAAEWILLALIGKVYVLLMIRCFVNS